MYNSEDNEIEPCFTKDDCNVYVHIAVNNYDLHQLNTNPKRIYYYSPPAILSNLNFKDMKKEHIKALFGKYKLNSQGDIVQKYDNKSYLDKYLLKIPNSLLKELEDKKSGKDLPENEVYFQKLLEFKQNSQKHPHNIVYPRIEHYDEDEYSTIDIISRTDDRLLEHLKNKISELGPVNDEDIDKLVQKLPENLEEYTSENDLISVHYRYLENYITQNKKVVNSEGSFDTIFYSKDFIKNKIPNHDLKGIKIIILPCMSTDFEILKLFEKTYLQEDVLIVAQLIEKNLAKNNHTREEVISFLKQKKFNVKRYDFNFSHVDSHLEHTYFIFSK